MLVYNRQSACHIYGSNGDTLVPEPSCKMRNRDLWKDEPFHVACTELILCPVIESQRSLRPPGPPGPILHLHPPPLMGDQQAVVMVVEDPGNQMPEFDMRNTMESFHTTDLVSGSNDALSEGIPYIFDTSHK